MEHITTRQAADFVAEHAGTGRLAASLTPQHMLLNRNALFQGGLRPHAFCLPILKREEHRQAVLAAACSGSPAFFLGTDSAPHPKHAKESACGCAGIYSAPVALGLYAAAFEGAGRLDRLEGFASLHGPDFYGLPRNAGEARGWQSPMLGVQVDGPSFCESLAWTPSDHAMMTWYSTRVSNPLQTP